MYSSSLIARLSPSKTEVARVFAVTRALQPHAEIAALAQQDPAAILSALFVVIIVVIVVVVVVGGGVGGGVGVLLFNPPAERVEPNPHGTTNDGGQSCDGGQKQKEGKKGGLRHTHTRREGGTEGGGQDET